MSAERIIGVDFGTSTSVIRVKRYENGQPVGEKLETKEVTFGGGSSTVPTLVMKKDGDDSLVYYGHEAQQKKRHFTNFHSFKVDLESTDPVKREQARKLTREFFGFMANQYKEQSEGGHLGNLDDKERTIISYPVKWSQETKQFMLDTAEKAGFPNVSGLDEAQAAIKAVTVMSAEHLEQNGLLYSGVPSNILLIDMGAGTTDLVLCRYTPGTEDDVEILNTWPKSGDILFGGKEIDSLLQNFFLDKMEEEDARTVFHHVGADKFKSWKEENVSPALRNHDSVSDFEALDSCVDMMGIDMEEYCLDRHGFEECLKNYLKQFPILINDCIGNSGIKGADVDLVIVTGGHSQWYFVQEMLAGNMPQLGNVDLPKIKENPSRIIPISRPQETVALGLAYNDICVKIAVNSEQEEERRRKAEEERRRKAEEECRREEERRQEEEQNRREEAQMQEEIRKNEVLQEDFDAVEKEYTSESEFEFGHMGEDLFIRKYTGKSAFVSIPPMVHGRKVVAIGDDAFTKKLGNKIIGGIKQLETVIIPDTVRKIGAYAFYGCKYLNTVMAHKNIEFIGGNAFFDCINLQTIDFGMGVCRDRTVMFPKNLQEIGRNAFDQLVGLTQICLLKEVTLSKNTKIYNTLGGKTFSGKKCKISYYED